MVHPSPPVDPSTGDGLGLHYSYSPSTSRSMCRSENIPMGEWNLSIHDQSSAATFMKRVWLGIHMGEFAEVDRRIGYVFEEPALLRRALTHASADAVSKEDRDQAKRLS